MRLFSFTPEVSRLRRIAKACAAGEISRSEYRAARHEVIRGMLDRQSDRHDDTVPRFDPELTLERPFLVESPASTRSNRFRRWLLVLTILVVAAALVPASTWADAQGASADATNVQEVARLEWRVPDHIDLPQAEVDAFLEERLARLQASDRPQGHGFTAAELAQVGRFLNAIGAHDPEVRWTREDLLDLKALVEQQKAKRGLSANQRSELALELQTWLRERGYPVARAYIPEQIESADVLSIEVELGVLSGVELANVADAGRERVLAPFERMVGETVERDAFETRLNAFNRVSRGASVRAGFRPGPEVGDTEMLVHVAPRSRYALWGAVDNYGLDAFGSERVSAGVEGRRLLLAGDRADVSVTRAVGSERHAHGALRYAAPLVHRNLSFAGRLLFADLEFETGVPANGLMLDGELLDTRQFTRQDRREFRYGFGWHDVDLDGRDQRVAYASAGIQGHRLWDASKVAVDAEAILSFGTVGGDSEADSSFVVANAQVSGWTPLGEIGGRSFKLLLGGTAQYSPDRLPITRSFGLSRPDRNAGLPPGSVFTDSGLVLTADLKTRLPVGYLTLGLADGYGADNDAENTWFRLTTARLGWHAELNLADGHLLRTELTLAHPLTHDSNGDLDDDGTQLFWSLRYAR